MRREKLFSKDGCYSRVLANNVLLHDVAVSYGTRVVKNLLKNHEPARMIRVLDLACGAEPVSISKILNHFPERRLSYTGIDINPDQVSFARHQFHFPANIQETIIFEGNAWDPRSSIPQGQYDLVFMGLNLHHGTPEEVYYLATQLSAILDPQGVFISHDVFRPDDQAYQRRPDHHPLNKDESFRLLEAGCVADVQLPAITAQELGSDTPMAKWRQDYNELIHRTLIERGVGRECADLTYQHTTVRDYPISLADFRYIFEQAEQDFKVKTIRYGHIQPLMDYIAMALVSKDHHLLDEQ